MSDDRFADYRRGIDTGVMKHATPNAMLDCLQEFERLGSVAHMALVGQEELQRALSKTEAEFERLQAIVDRLPKTADGVPVVPGMEVWGQFEYRCNIENAIVLESIYSDAVPASQFWYSTCEAAEAARAEVTQ